MRLGHRTKPFQFSTMTSRKPGEVLEGLQMRPIPGISVSEKGPSYLIFSGRSGNRYTTDVAIALGIVILLFVLIIGSFAPPLLFLLPIALLPALPLRFDSSTMVAISAVVDPQTGATRVTAHGEASGALSASLDAYFASLPQAAVPAPASEDAPAAPAPTGQ